MTQSKSVEAQIRTQLAAGNALSANDLATAAIEAGAASDRVKYLYLQSLAGSGGSQLALRRYDELAPAPAARDEDRLALHARLYKDLAFAGIEADYNLPRAAAEYEAAHELTGGVFSLVNAASLHLLCGARKDALRMARKALEILATEDPQDDIARYYWAASRAEAHLVAAEYECAGAALAVANGLARADLYSRSRSRAQIRRIASAQGIDPAIALGIELPDAYVLDMPDGRLTRLQALPAELAARLAGSPSFAVMDRDLNWFGAIRDIGRSGGHLHLVLQSDQLAEAELWEQQFGQAASRKLRRLIKSAARTSTIRGFQAEEGGWVRREAYRLVYGLAKVAASELDQQVKLRRLSVSDQGWQLHDDLLVPPVRSRARPAETPQEVQRRSVGLVFTDIVGFRRYTDTDIRDFWATLMPALAAAIEAQREMILLQQTWGDALHLVTEDARSAVTIAHLLVDTVRSVRRTQKGMLRQLQIRVGAHYAPAFEGYDPIENIRTYYGTQLSFAASVEPVTPPGQVYATEACAAALALEADEDFHLEYAGEIDLAKRFGSFRLFAVRPRS